MHKNSIPLIKGSFFTDEKRRYCPVFTCCHCRPVYACREIDEEECQHCIRHPSRFCWTDWNCTADNNGFLQAVGSSGGTNTGAVYGISYRRRYVLSESVCKQIQHMDCSHTCICCGRRIVPALCGSQLRIFRSSFVTRSLPTFCQKSMLILKMSCVQSYF